MTVKRLGILAGNGRLPELILEAARAEGTVVHVVGLDGEVDPALATSAATFDLVRVGELKRIARILLGHGVTEMVMAGGVRRVGSALRFRPDAGMWKVLRSVRSLRDDELLRAIAAWFEAEGLKVVSATARLPQVRAGEGRLCGPPLSRHEEKDLTLGVDVATRLGTADVGQAVAVKGGVVLAVEAIEGTDATIRRAGELGGPGAVVVKRAKPGQDERFDLPTVGLVTLEVMREAGARVLAVEAGRTVVLDAERLFRTAEQLGITVVGVALAHGAREASNRAI